MCGTQAKIVVYLFSFVIFSFSFFLFKFQHLCSCHNLNRRTNSTFESLLGEVQNLTPMEV